MSVARPGEAGFSFLELLVSLSLLTLAMGGIAGLLIQNSQINRADQMSTEVQATARNCLSMIVQVLRSAGWDPRNAGFPALVLDPTPTNTTNYIEVLADLNEDGDTADAGEDVLIRWNGTQIEWRTSSDTTQPFVVLAASPRPCSSPMRRPTRRGSWCGSPRAHRRPTRDPASTSATR
ncbi:MAG: hypothetical protein DMF50_01430 [Acidobacteria bacterium]|nr:MAG: hypothetical protein DMF50_01430 [Acidobacteriota bacterium]